MHAIPLHVRTENGEFDFNALMALVFNGETAGGFRLANTSSVRDGIFDCLLLEKRNFLVSCFAMVRYLCGGHPRSVRHLRAATLQISSPIDEPTGRSTASGAPASRSTCAACPACCAWSARATAEDNPARPLPYRTDSKTISGE